VGSTCKLDKKAAAKGRTAIATTLEIKGITKDFGGLRALSKVDLEVQEGQIFGLIGPNGSGKTTLLNVITGYFPPTAGLVVYKGTNISGLSPYLIAKRGIVRTFQITSIFPNLTVEENVIAGSYLKTKGSFWGAFFQTRVYRKEEKRLRQKATEILALLRMEEKRNVIAKALGLGEQRRIEIAIALATEPKLLLLDEPAAGLNPTEALELVHVIETIRDRGITLVVVEHNMKVIMQLCSRIAVLDYGSKITEGTPGEVANNENVIRVYLGGKKEIA